MIKKFAFTAALASLLAIPATSAQQDQLSANDKDFVEFAGEVDLSSIRLGQMAQAEAHSGKVKEFGLMMERAHTQDLKALAAIATKTGDVAPDTLDDVHKNRVSHLKKQTGKSFDHEFLKAVVREHENALVSFKREADHGFNPDLQSYAKKALPELEKHLKEAKQLASSAD